MCKKEKEGQVGTLKAPKQSDNPPKKQVIKLGKGNDTMIIQSGFNEEMATIATLAMIESSKVESSQRGSQMNHHVNQNVREPKPNTPKGLQEHQNPIQEKRYWLNPRL